MLPWLQRNPSSSKTSFLSFYCRHLGRTLKGQKTSSVASARIPSGIGANLCTDHKLLVRGRSVSQTYFQLTEKLSTYWTYFPWDIAPHNIYKHTFVRFTRFAFRHCGHRLKNRRQLESLSKMDAEFFFPKGSGVDDDERVKSVDSSCFSDETLKKLVKLTHLTWH